MKWLNLEEINNIMEPLMLENKEIPVVLEIKNLYVGYYKDLNIIQDINIKVLILK